MKYLSLPINHLKLDQKHNGTCEATAEKLFIIHRVNAEVILHQHHALLFDDRYFCTSLDVILFFLPPKMAISCSHCLFHPFAQLDLLALQMITVMLL
jgi:hypothetical protein